MAWTTASAGQPITADLWNADVRNQTIARCTSLTRPASPSAGQYIYETDTARTYLYDGSAWVLVGGHAAWVTYTPTLTASTTSPTLGTGSSATGAYWRDGRLCHVQASVTFGSSGVNAGSGSYRLSLPFTGGSRAQNVVGTFWAVDSSAAAWATGFVTLAAAGTYVTFGYNTDTFFASSILNNAPWTWAASDSLSMSITYETA